MEKIVEVVKETIGEEGGLWRKVSIYFCHRYGGMKLREIGEQFGIGDAAVSATSKRLLTQAEKDQKVREGLDAVRKLLNVET